MRDESRGHRRRRLRRRRAAASPAPASRGDRVRRDQPEPGGEADRRGASGARRAHRRALLRRESPARPRAGATSSSSASSTASRPGSPARCSTPGPGLVVDLAADFRVQDPRLYERYYGAHPAPGAGAPLHLRAGRRRRATSLRGASAIAAPGCFATAAQLALYPLAARRARRPPVALRGDRVERRRGAAQADDAPSGAGAQPVRLLGAGSPARSGGAAVAGGSGPGGPTRRRG